MSQALDARESRRVLTIAVTRAGRSLAARLPYEHSTAGLAESLHSHWAAVDAFVAVASIGAVVRVVAPMLGTKATDPAVVCVDEAGLFAVPVLGGHHGANELAREVAALLGAEPVLTTASDSSGVPALDVLAGSGLVAEGDLPRVARALVDDEPVFLDNLLDWPVPRRLEEIARGGPGSRWRIVVTDSGTAGAAGVVVLRPQSLVVGVGASSGPPGDELAALLESALQDAGLSRSSVTSIATIDRRAGEAGIAALGLPVEAFTARDLAEVTVPHPSSIVADAVGTPSVAEAAAILGAGAGSELVIAKQASPHCTVAVARRRRPSGHLAVVGLGPGSRAERTPAADRAVRGAEVIVGYSGYLEQCADLLSASMEVMASPIGAELERARTAVKWAESGRRVAVVCSGDPGVYAMASLVLEEAGENAGVGIEIVAGVTASLASAARLGAPLGHDHLVLSLSDLLTPWDLIVRRVEAARDADLVLVLYNPRSPGRDWQLGAARDLLLERRPPSTPVGLVSDAGRAAETVSLTTLASLDPELVGMTTCVIIGSSTTRVVGGRMVTPRGYRRAEDA